MFFLRRKYAPSLTLPRIAEEGTYFRSLHRSVGDGMNPLCSLPCDAGEGIVDSALAEPSGAGDDAWARYPQTGNFITNVSACQGGGTMQECPLYA